MVAESQSCSVLKICLVYFSMRLGVPFIALRGKGAVGHRIVHETVWWHTGPCIVQWSEDH
jgi:hypothetical protein